jgi:hypothetical protein
MQNILQLQDDLKNFSEQQLVREMQMPSGQVPQFLVLSELGRRKRVKEDFNRQQAAGAPTVAEETVAAAGMSQAAATGIAQSMAPKTSMAENTGIGAMMPKQPTRMADGGVVKMAPGGSVGRAGTQSGVEILKRLYPEVYEAVKDDPKQLLEAAKAAARANVAREPEQTGIESLETDMTEQAAPFVPKIPMDTSGATRPVGPSGTMFNVPMGQIGEFFSDPFAAVNPSTSSYEDYELRYEPAKPGEYYYKGNAFILSPDGTMIERKSGVPVTGTTKDKIIAANATQVPIENYGQPPTSNIASFEKMIADQQEGMPVESVRTTTRSTSTAPVEIDPAKIAEAQVTPSPSTIATPSMAALSPNVDLQVENVPQAEETTRSSVSRPSFDTGDSATIQGSPTTDFSIEPGSPAETDAIRAELADKRTLGIADAGRSVVEDAKNDTLGALESRFITGDKRPIENLINKRALEYLQSDTYTPPEDIYDLGPEGRVKYETENPAERKELSAAVQQRLFDERLEADRLKEKRMDYLPSMETELQDARVADLIGDKISADNTFEVPDSLGKSFVDAGADLIESTGRILSDAAQTGSDMAIGRKASRSNEVVLGKGAEFIDPATTQKAKIDADKAALDAMMANATGTGTGSKSGSGSGRGGAGGGLEGQLADMLKDMDKSREQDKWLALANTGLALMASKSPTLGGALGEAGMAGMKQLREGKQQYSKDKMTILALQQRIDASKRAAASKSSGLSASQSLTRGLAILKQGQDMMEDAQIAQDPMAAERAQQLINYGNALMGIPNIGSTGTGAIKAPSAS